MSLFVFLLLSIKCWVALSLDDESCCLCGGTFAGSMPINRLKKLGLQTCCYVFCSQVEVVTWSGAHDGVT